MPREFNMFKSICVIILSTFSVSAITVKRIGNPIMATDSSVDVPGAIFLADDVILSEGILFAYSAYFRRDTYMRFQVWRPVNGSDDSSAALRKLALVSELRVKPSVMMSREDVSIYSRLYIFY